MPFKAKTQLQNIAPTPHHKRSLFSITINPNSIAEYQSQHYYTLRDFLSQKQDEYFNNEDNFKQLIVFTNKKHYYTPKYIKDVNIKSTVEYGARNKNLHINAYCEIIHDSHIKLNIELMRQLFSYDGIRPHVHVGVPKFDPRSDEEKIKDYPDKDVREE